MKNYIERNLRKTIAQLLRIIVIKNLVLIKKKFFFKHGLTNAGLRNIETTNEQLFFTNQQGNNNYFNNIYKFEDVFACSIINSDKKQNESDLLSILSSDCSDVCSKPANRVIDYSCHKSNGERDILISLNNEFMFDSTENLIMQYFLSLFIFESLQNFLCNLNNIICIKIM